MKALKYILGAIAGAITFVSCEKKDYPAGLEELEHHYYAIFVPNNNTGITVSRTQTALIKFPVQFYSTFTRSYDAVAKYAFVKTGYPSPAVLGQDFAVVDKNGAVIPTTDSTYFITFPQAKQAMDTIYIKLLNSAVAGQRKIDIQILDNQTTQFDVDFFSTACKRPITIN
jgi:hypothetical protein